MTEKIINGSPHAVYLLNEDNTVLRVFPKSNGMIRVIECTEEAGMIDGIPITTTKWKEAPDMPKFQKGTYYIVSQLVKNVLPYRTDLLVPKNIVRDDSGNIIGCKCLDVSTT